MTYDLSAQFYDLSGLTYDLSSQFDNLPHTYMTNIKSFQSNTSNVDASMSGNILLGSSTGVTTFILPGVSNAGLQYTFIANTENTYTIKTNASSEYIKGHIISSSGFSSIDNSINTLDISSTIGDRIEIISDGSCWFTTSWVYHTITSTSY